MQRLDKLLSEAGVASRKELKVIIKAGRVTVNGTEITQPEYKLDEAAAKVCVDGREVPKQRIVLLMMNKPAGYVTSADDPRDATVMELLPEQYRYLKPMPVGRLDKDTEGLLLFTNDGQLAHRLLSPRNKVWKQYYAEHEGAAQQSDVEAFRSGMILENGEVCLPAELQPLEKGKSIVTVCEGKYHQVRRMMAARGMPVTYLKRISEGGLELGNLASGEVCEIAPDALHCDFAQGCADTNRKENP